MIITKLIGGLGNQMFQYSLGRSLSLKNNDELKLDVTNYAGNQEGITPRQYALGVFNIKEKFASQTEIDKLKTKNIFFKKIGLVKKTHYLEKRANSYDDRVMEITGDAYLEGFWQTEKYFKNIRETLLKDFSLRDKISDPAEAFVAKIQSAPSASIHIRRGDYVSRAAASAHHGTCSLDYYERAIGYLKSKNQSTVFFVFSDDISWAKDNLKESDLIFVSSPEIKDYEELILMANCQDNITANSAFSWWGAWLNKNPDKIVIAPKKWFRNDGANRHDIIPGNWLIF
ncbi:MAG: alpha-1,2-fucosyltransferase [Patescibacteria group bacterium]|nr:alpha-1,2-fucosyltransferase [Patescibacteria group bacterium]